jgi:TRAP-type C4-dicarboxylate transport system substrate-binding protein
MKKVISINPVLLILLGLFVFNTASPEFLHAQRKRTITINLASALPRNSPWGRTLDRVAAEWIRATNGEVTLHIFHQYPGSEGDYLMKLRQDKIQAGIFTSLALNSIAPEVMALSIPFLIQNNNELDAVLNEVRPILNASIEQEGYVNLAWAKAGWVKIFSRSPVYIPDDLRKIKLGTSPDEQELMDAFRTMGYNMVPVTLNDVTQRLNSGLLDAVYQSPISVSAFQLYRVSKNMSTVNLAPFMGGILMSKIAWAGIPEKYRAPLLEICDRARIEIESSFQNGETEAINAMQQDGLIVNRASPAQEQLWSADMQKYLPDLLSRNVFNKNMYDRIQVILQNYRQGR